MQNLNRGLQSLGYPGENAEATQVIVDLVQTNGVFMAIFVIALTPAICEEVLFRGIVLNSTREWRAGSAIFLNGFLFGAMHMSLANLPALTIMGAYMAFIVWRSGSIFQSCLVHFINNALAVLMLHYS